MTIRHRLRKLEQNKPAARTGFEIHSKLSAYLSSIGERLRASGDIEDRLDRSPAERLAMALQRGDAETAQAILSAAVGREVTP
jgi:hypothetical protein